MQRRLVRHALRVTRVERALVESRPRRPRFRRDGIEDADAHLGEQRARDGGVERCFVAHPEADRLLEVALAPQVIAPPAVDVEAGVERFGARVGLVGGEAHLEEVGDGGAVRHEDGLGPRPRRSHDAVEQVVGAARRRAVGREIRAHRAGGAARDKALLEGREIAVPQVECRDRRRPGESVNLLRVSRVVLQHREDLELAARLRLLQPLDVRRRVLAGQVRILAGQLRVAAVARILDEVDVRAVGRERNFVLGDRRAGVGDIVVHADLGA